MDDVAIIKLLYQKLLGRNADIGGLSTHVADLALHGDLRRTVLSLVQSEEYLSSLRPKTKVVDSLPTLLKRPLTIIDVGAQKLVSEDHIYQPLLELGVECVCHGFEPLTDRLQELREDDEKLQFKLYDAFVGDGSERTFYINNDDATSSLLPLHIEFNTYFNHIQELRTIRKTAVRTYKLDDLLASVMQVDLLKLDIQGFELAALEGARNLLGRTNVVHCEVEFGPIYLDQPLFSDVEKYLRSLGFEFVDFHGMGRYFSPNMPQVNGSPERLLWADAIFIRVLRENDPFSRDDAVSQALILQRLYHKHSLAQLTLFKAGWRKEEIQALFGLEPA